MRRAALIAAALIAALSRAAAAPEAPAQGFVGVILPGESADVSAPIEGRLTRVAVRLGDRVRRGQLLCALAEGALRAERVQALAALQAARVEVERAAIELEEARERLRRVLPLGEGTPAISGDELARARYQERLAAARLRAARAQVAERRARAESAEARRAEAEVRAPFDGVVAARLVDRGARVAPGAPIVRLVGDGDLRVRFAMPAEVRTDLGAGRAVRVAVPELGLELPGEIEQVAPEVDAASRMVVAEARLEVPRPAPAVLAGRAVLVRARSL